jgi:hypothetical protein
MGSRAVVIVCRDQSVSVKRFGVIEPALGVVYARARIALRELGPHLFPLISQSEVRLTGARSLKSLPAAKAFRRADRYEMAGIIDVVTDVEMTKHAGNQIVEIASKKLGALPGQFELIIDYKGSRRQPNLTTISGQNPTLWDQYAWQVLTYAELRAKQPGSKQVAAGILIYINELLPLESDLVELDREVNGVVSRDGIKLSTDESVDPKLIRQWRDAARVAAEKTEKEQEVLSKAGDFEADLKSSRNMTTQVPWDVRLRRAMRLIRNDADKRATSLGAFDGIVYKIECSRGDEFHGNGVLKSWSTNPNDRSTCAACDSRTWCPTFSRHYADGKAVLPETPKVRTTGR